MADQSANGHCEKDQHVEPWSVSLGVQRRTLARIMDESP